MTNTIKKRIPLSEALDETGIKKKVISERLGFSPTHYSSFVRNTKQLKPAQVDEILKMTGLTIDQIEWN